MTSVTNQEERYRLEPPNGARPKWTRPGRPLPVIEEPRSPGATVGVDGPGMNGGGMRVPAPALPPLQHDRQSAGVATPTRMDADRHGVFRAPGGTADGRGTRLASHVFAEARDKDVISDRRDLTWSPENVLIDTVARLQRDLNDMRAESRYLRTPGVQDALPPSRHVTVTSTKVLRFAGTTSREQYRQVFDAIVLSNGWDDATSGIAAALSVGGGCLECGSVGSGTPSSVASRTGGCADRTLWFAGTTGRLSATI